MEVKNKKKYTNGEVKELRGLLNILLNKITEEKISIFHLNFGLNKNSKRLKDVVEEIVKATDPRLVELDNKAFDLGNKSENSALLTEDEKFNLGLTLLSEEELKERTELGVVYDKNMLEENDFEMFVLDPSKLEDLSLDYPHFTILEKFLPEDK